MVSNALTRDSSKLASVAEELVKAACSHVESTSLDLARETVDGLKKLSLDLSSIHNSVVELKRSFDSRINILSQNISTLQAETMKMSKTVQKSRNWNGQSPMLLPTHSSFITKIINMLRLTAQNLSN
jgi:hypothetical protein